MKPCANAFCSPRAQVAMQQGQFGAGDGDGDENASVVVHAGSNVNLDKGRGSKRARDSGDDQQAASAEAAPSRRVTRAQANAAPAAPSVGAPQAGAAPSPAPPAQEAQLREEERPQGSTTPAPPAAPLLPPAPPPPLNADAIEALMATQDAQAYNEHLRTIRMDDALAEVASRRGLLARFVLRTAHADPSRPQLAVEAPEFATVEYLKRRIMKAKLMRKEVRAGREACGARRSAARVRGALVGRPRRRPAWSQTLDPACAWLTLSLPPFLAPLAPTPTPRLNPQLLLPQKFVLKRLAGQVLQELPSLSPARDEVLLFNAGFRAGATYELFLSSARATTDAEQQRALVGGAGRRGAGAGPAGGPLDPLRAQHLALLQGPGPGPAPRSAPRAAATAAAEPAAAGLYGAARVGSVADEGGGGGAAALQECGQSPGGRLQPRRQRWQPEEVEALVGGVQALGASWALIKQRCSGPGRIQERRTQVDLKDKWRNLVRQAACDPARPSRGAALSEELKATILRLAFSADVGEHEVAESQAAGAEGEAQGYATPPPPERA
jgi:hypothetical protein